MQNFITNLICLAFIITALFGCDSKPRRTVTAEATSDSILIKIKPAYNIFVENSASMNGYVKGITEFEQSVYNYLTDIKISDLTDSLRLNYINSKIIQRGSDIEDFILKLEPSSFAQMGGDISVTDLSDVIKNVLQNTSDSTVSILVSDLIFSPGRGKNAEEYLVNQQIGIKSKVAEHLKKYPSHSVIVYQLTSKFDGRFFDKNDTPHSYAGKRPFYILIVGNNDNLADLMRKCPASKFKGDGVMNTFAISGKGKALNYAVQYGSGNFSLDKKNPKNSIIKANKDTKGSGEKLLRFNVNVDFSHLLCDDGYLLDVNQYDISDKDFQLKVENHQSEKYTHTLKLSTGIVKPSTLHIKLKSTLPQWIDDYNDKDGIGINESNSQKTYGVKYLLSGIYEAFTKDGEVYTDLIVNINK